MKTIKSTLYQFRIDKEEKEKTFEIFNKMGLKPAQAVRLFFNQVRRTNRIPFQIEHTPNKSTAKILKSKDYKGPFDSADDLFDELMK